MLIATRSSTAASGGLMTAASPSKAYCIGTSTRIAPSRSVSMATGVPSNSWRIQRTSLSSGDGGGAGGVAGAVAAGAWITVPRGAVGSDGVVAQPAASKTVARAASRRKVFMADDCIIKAESGPWALRKDCDPR